MASRENSSLSLSVLTLMVVFYRLQRHGTWCSNFLMSSAPTASASYIMVRAWMVTRALPQISLWLPPSYPWITTSIWRSLLRILTNIIKLCKTGRHNKGYETLLKFSHFRLNNRFFSYPSECAALNLALLWCKHQLPIKALIIDKHSEARSTSRLRLLN